MPITRRRRNCGQLERTGVDVALAVDLIETDLLDTYDVGIVFSGDTDLLPTIEVAFRRTPPHIEIASWRGPRLEGKDDPLRDVRSALYGCRSHISVGIIERWTGR